MSTDKSEASNVEPQNVELVDWISLEEWDAREREIISNRYLTFDEAAKAIDEKGPLELCTDRVNVVFTRTSGRFEDGIIVLRQSGLNVRRILISKENFELLYGDFQGCINHTLSNNAIGPEIEYAHIGDYGQTLGLDVRSIDPERRFDRFEIDTVATLQMLALRDHIISETPEDAAILSTMFDAGFTAGRTFSAVQNLATLEPNARQAVEARRKNVAKGKKSGSAERRHERLVAFMQEIEIVFQENRAIRSYEDVVLRVAFDRAIPKGSYGHGQFDNYCTAIRSEEPFKARFDGLFRKSLE